MAKLSRGLIYHHRLLSTVRLCHTSNYWCLRDYWISRCYGALPHSQLSTLQLLSYSLQQATPTSLCTILCQCVFLYLDISDAQDNVKCLVQPSLGPLIVTDMLTINLLSHYYSVSFSNASLHHLHSHANET